MDPTQQAALIAALMSGGQQNQAVQNTPTFGGQMNAPMQPQSPPPWQQALPPGFSGQPLPPSLYSVSPQQAMAAQNPQMMQQLMQQSNQPFGQ
jgi:hypothetical protein